MSGPKTKEIVEPNLAKSVHLPKPDQAALINTDGVTPLPARPKATLNADSGLSLVPSASPKAELPQDASKPASFGSESVAASSAKSAPLESAKIGHGKVEALRPDPEPARQQSEDPVKTKIEKEEQQTLKERLQFLNVQDIELMVARWEHHDKAEGLAKNLIGYIQQQRSFQCTAQELAMLDSLEFHLMRILAQINPNIRAQQQQQQALEEALDDDASSAGPEKVEEDEKESGTGGLDEIDSEYESEVTPRSKKGKARARARAKARQNRYRKWLARMLRAFRLQGSIRRGQGSAQVERSAEKKNERFIKTVRVFGRVVSAKTRSGVAGVKIISNTFGSVETGADGGFAFENVNQGLSYNLAPLKFGCSFSPLSVNDVALDFREHNFLVLDEE